MCKKGFFHILRKVPTKYNYCDYRHTMVDSGSVVMVVVEDSGSVVAVVEDSGSVVAVVEDFGSVVMVVEDSGSVVAVEDSDFPKFPPDPAEPCSYTYRQGLFVDTCSIGSRRLVRFSSRNHHCRTRGRNRLFLRT